MSNMKEKKQLDIYSCDRSHVLDVLTLLLSNIKKKQPTSLIRLGDAEGRFLGYPEFVDKEGDSVNVLDRLLELELGRTDFSSEDLRSLSLQIRASVKNADIIGLPRKKQYEAHESYRYVLQALERFHLTTNSQVFTDAAIHRYLQFGLFYRSILQNLNFLGVITGRPTLAPLIQKTFKINDIKSYLIPAEAIHPGGLEGEHFPDRFYSLKEELIVPFQGAIFLVGAGYLGKIYCDWIKKAGGIAIDIGSICDSWSNIGRLQHDYHKLKHYELLPNLTLQESTQRYNTACDHFDMDTKRLTQADIKKFESLLPKLSQHNQETN